MATAYKLFRLKSGRLYPLYVLSNQEVPLGVWLQAQSGERLPSGKVKAKLGKGLAYRPGWHCSDVRLNLPHLKEYVLKYLPDSSERQQMLDILAQLQ